ncbi:MAG: hypothetical protein WCQ99_16470, partial [Pseudomonadota bacterium]
SFFIMLCSFFAAGQPSPAEGKVFLAWGSGSSTVSGAGDVEFFCNGFIVVNAATEVQVLQGMVKKIELNDGRVVYQSFDGRIVASGQAMDITCGGNMYMYARCTGTVVLKGAGGYLAGFTWGVWSFQGVAVSLDSIQ